MKNKGIEVSRVYKNAQQGIFKNDVKQQRKTITVRKEVYDELVKVGNFKESFSDLLMRLTERWRLSEQQG